VPDNFWGPSALIKFNWRSPENQTNIWTRPQGTKYLNFLALLGALISRSMRIDINIAGGGSSEGEWHIAATHKRHQKSVSLILAKIATRTMPNLRRNLIWKTFSFGTFSEDNKWYSGP